MQGHSLLSPGNKTQLVFIPQFALRLCAFGQMHKVLGMDYKPVKPWKSMGASSKDASGNQKCSFFLCNLLNSIITPLLFCAGTSGHFSLPAKRTYSEMVNEEEDPPLNSKQKKFLKFQKRFQRKSCSYSVYYYYYSSLTS